MTDISPEDDELIRRYLAGQMAEAEVTMLETRIVEDPVFRNEVELTAAIKDGMRKLDGRGEIQTLLANRAASRHRLQLAVAASLGAVALGIASFLLIKWDEPATATVTETLRFEPTRGVEPQADIVWTRRSAPTRLEMRFDVGLEPAASYEVEIVRVDLPAAAPALARTAWTSADGDVVLEVDGALLEHGVYEIRLEPGPTTGPGEPVTYTLAVDQ